jgi:hypothetical protein
VLNKNLLIFFILYFLLQPDQVRSQGMNTEFGQNIIQYREFDWSVFKTENFDVYYYTGGKELATYAARFSESQLGPLGKILDYRLSGRIDLVVSNSLSELKQSNISNPETQFNPGGTTHIKGNKIFVYFNGNHEDLNRQIKKGIAWVLVNEMLYGSTIQERVQNSALLNLPDWYVSGIVSYMGNEWSVEMDNSLKDQVRSSKKLNFNQMVYADAAFTGHTVWKYLVERYGERAIPNILYLTRITRNLENAFYFVLGFGINTVVKDWTIYYRNIYSREDDNRNLPPSPLSLDKNLSKLPVTEVKLSKDGNQLAFVTHDNGKYKVRIYQMQTGKLQTVLKGGFRSAHAADYSFPLLDWDPVYGMLSAIYEKNGKIFLTTFDLEKKENTHTELTKFDKVTSFDYSDNGRTLVLSAIRKGQSDLYTLDMGSKRERQLTNDLADDLYPRFTNNSTFIIFSSNRNNDTIGPPGSEFYIQGSRLDIFIFDYLSGEKALHRLTRTPHIDETWPLQYNKEYYAWLTEQNGVINRDAGSFTTLFDKHRVILHYKDTLRLSDTLMLDSLQHPGSSFTYKDSVYMLGDHIASIDTIAVYKDIIKTFPLTDYSRNIQAHESSLSAGRQIDLIFYAKAWHISVQPLLRPDEVEQKHIFRHLTRYRLKTGYGTDSSYITGSNIPLHLRMRLKPSTDIKEPDTVVKSTVPYTFLTDFSPPPSSWPGKKKEEKISTVEINPGNSKPYTFSFSPQYIVTQVDNSVINTYYQPYRPLGKPFFNPGIYAQLKISITDLMQDYRVTGGFRIAANLSGGTDYFFSFESLKKRLDHKVSLFRQSRFMQEENSFLRTITSEIRLTEKYSFNTNSSLRGNVFYRADKTMFLVTDVINAGKVDQQAHRVGGKLEYIFDNTLPLGLNLWQGTRAKVFAETFRSISGGAPLSIAGLDIRHYLKVHRQVIWANRLAASTSFGGSRVLFTLGGVDNWVFPSTEKNSEVNAQVNYVFQSLATNMRGFSQSIRNGSSYAVFNSELRIPVFTWLSGHPVRSDVLRNFMIVPFIDAGTAWNGPNPYSDQNDFNKTVMDFRSVTVELTNLKSPFVAGYGVGLRMKLLSYYFRTDLAYGIEDGEERKPVLYLSVCTDF